MSGCADFPEFGVGYGFEVLAGATEFGMVEDGFLLDELVEDGGLWTAIGHGFGWSICWLIVIKQWLHERLRSRLH